ncbi:MAG TPA: cellulase family glycosylhydrolase [Marinagarivorans sp.]
MALILNPQAHYSSIHRFCAKNCLKSLVAVLASAVLASCGSGGGGSDNGGAGVASNAVVSSSIYASSSSAGAISSSEMLSRSSSSPHSEPAASCAWLEQPLRLDSAAESVVLEAENFDICEGSVNELAAAPNEAGYRETSVGLQADADASNGFYLGQTEAGEHVEFTLDVAKAGLYTFSYRVRVAANSEPAIRVSVGARALAAPNVDALPAGDNAWQILDAANIYLSEGLQTLRFGFDAGGLEIDAVYLSSEEVEALTAHAIVANMGTGINLGNTLDEPKGQDWGATPESKAYFEGIKAAGFKHVRIPVTWGGRTEASAPYRVEPEWLDRVEQAVDWALAEGLYVIVNAHHEDWLKIDFNAQKQARIEAIWRQVAERLQHKPQRLIFEILNEPNGMTLAQVDALNPVLLAAMRASNPHRAVVFSGSGFTPYTELLMVEVPTGANLIGNFHSYDPWPFAGQCTRGWGSTADRAELRAIYQQVADWSANQNIPVTVNEFGAAHLDFEKPDNVCDVDDRKAYLRHHVVLQKEFGIAGTVWDDDGSFQIYKRASNTWDGALESLIF